MKISTKGRYAMTDAGSGIEQHRSADQFKRCCETAGDFRPSGTGTVVVRRLWRRSVRRTGDLLRKAPEEYTVGMILRLTEGIAGTGCMSR